MQAYAHAVGSRSQRSNGERLAVPMPPQSHSVLANGAVDIADAASSFPGRYQSGGPDTPSVSSMLQPARENGAMAHAAAAQAPGTALRPVSYGAHTTMQPQLLASAFSAADDPPLLQQSWQLDALRKSDNAIRAPAPPPECALPLSC